jgi:hypothetical protein
MNLSDQDDETIEKLLDLAIDCINILGDVEIGDLQGTAGSKTITVSDKERFVIFAAARIIYWGFHQQLGTAGVGPLQVTVPDVMGNSTTWQALKDIAEKLHETDWSEAFL